MYVFKDGIKPKWEDPANIKGGYFNFWIEKNMSNKIWENVVLLTICPLKECIQYINGIRLKIGKDNDAIQVWLSIGEKEKDKI